MTALNDMFISYINIENIIYNKSETIHYGHSIFFKWNIVTSQLTLSMPIEGWLSK